MHIHEHTSFTYPNGFACMCVCVCTRACVHWCVCACVHSCAKNFIRVHTFVLHDRIECSCKLQAVLSVPPPPPTHTLIVTCYHTGIVLVIWKLSPHCNALPPPTPTDRCFLILLRIVIFILEACTDCRLKCECSGSSAVDFSPRVCSIVFLLVSVLPPPPPHTHTHSCHGYPDVYRPILHVYTIFRLADLLDLFGNQTDTAPYHEVRRLSIIEK